MRPLVVLLLCGCQPVERLEQSRFDGPIQGIRVEVDAGDARISGRGDDSVEVLQATRGPSGSVSVTTRMEDGVLVIEGRCSVLAFCTVDLDLAVPAQIPVDVRSGAGEIELGALAGDIGVELGSGGVTGLALGGGALRARVGWGDVQVSFSEPPSDLAVDLARGDARLVLPAGRYDLDLVAFDGVSVDGVEDGGEARIHVRTQGGRAVVVADTR